MGTNLVLLPTSYFDKLSVETLKNGTCLILRNNKDILVPNNEREEMLNLAHAHNHRGAEGMLDQLRGKVWWPNMAKQTHRLVNQCDPCQRLSWVTLVHQPMCLF